MTPTADLPADVHAERHRRRLWYSVVLAALIPVVVVLFLAGSLLVGPLLFWATLLWAVGGAVWITSPVRAYRRLERRLQAEAHIRARQQ
ncbi:hypothetical protein [Actinomadura opuntiae]|uniref:hypothetical protein n=1 Tax=Actinomadura sp. OS1-43 TaxID=604315 RepID=UPI00255AF824|nr:hypothetical protein [Actinomadura sp. OS1-43]MDL4812762.1 hypothetical protein [Actinomadura sp. OS1-43]